MAVDAVVIKSRLRGLLSAALPLAAGLSLPLMAAILPEERLDALYHSYEGDEVRISGPSVQVRGNVGEHWSMNYHYYVDNITSASVDVRTYGSPYMEQRVENSVSVDYLSDKSTVSASFTNSEENDYSSNTSFFGVSHDMFGQLTTVGLGFSLGQDEVRRGKSPVKVGDYNRNTDSDVMGEVTRHSYSVDISQIVTKNTIIGLGYEAITDTGYLHNPYRNVIVNGSLIGEDYPGVHTSSAVALRSMYFLPYRAKLYGELRVYSDSWGVKGRMYQLGYTHPFGKNLIFDINYRTYGQSKASFYQDSFNEKLVYVARDKELSTFTSDAISATLNYTVLSNPWWIFDKGSANVSFTRLLLNYEDFLDRTPVGSSTSPQLATYCATCQPLSLDASIIQFYMTLWY